MEWSSIAQKRTDSAQEQPESPTHTSPSPSPPPSTPNLRVGNSQNQVISSPEAPHIFTNSPMLSNTTTALEMSLTTAIFITNHQKVEKSYIFSPKTPKTPAPSVIEPTNDIARAHRSLTAPRNVALWPPALPISASSPQIPQHPVVTELRKSVLLRTIFKAQASSELQASTAIATTLKICSKVARFAKNHQKIENPLIFNKSAPRPLVPGDLKLEDNVGSFLAPVPIVPTLETCSEMVSFMKNYQNIEIFSLKSLILNENRTYFQTVNTCGVLHDPATHPEEETACIESHFPHSKTPSAATSSLALPPLSDYVSPITPMPIIWHLEIVANDIPASGKDPPISLSLLSLFYTLLEKISTHLVTLSSFHCSFQVLYINTLLSYITYGIYSRLFFVSFIFVSILHSIFRRRGRRHLRGGHME